MENPIRARVTAGAEKQDPYLEALHGLPCGALVILRKSPDTGAFLIVEANQQFLDEFAAGPVSPVGVDISAVVEGAAADSIVSLLDEVNRTGNPKRRPIVVQRDGGLVGWRDARAYRLERSGFLACTFPDADFFYRVMDNLFGYLGIFTKDGILVDTNSAPLQEAGVARADVIGLPIWETPWFSGAPDLQAKIRQVVARAAEGERVDVEIPLKIRGEKIALVQGTFAPLRDHDGGISLIVGFGVDVTDRANAIKELRDSEMLFRSFIDNMPSPIALKSADGCFLLTNKAQADYLNLPEISVIGRTSTDICTPDQAARAIAHDRRVLETKKVVMEERFVDTPNGRRDFLITKFPIFDEAGSIRRIGVIGTDISENKKAEDAARLTEQRIRHLELNLARLERVNSLGTMLSGLAHELNQPLAALQVYGNRLLALAEEWPAPPAGLVDTLGEMQRLTNLAHKIMLRLRGSVEPSFSEPTQIDCADAVAEVLEMVRPDVTEAGIDIQYDPPPGQVLVMANTIDLQLILSNLVRNSREALSVATAQEPPCIRIEIEADDAEDMICITVTDNGPGVDDASKNLVFTPFYTTKPTGMGLGLSMGQRLAEGMGGYLKIFDNTPSGTIVHLCLPRSPA